MRLAFRASLTTGLALVFVIPQTVASAGPSPQRTPERGLEQAVATATTNRGRERTAAVFQNFKLVGHSDLGGGIDFADVWAHGDFAYVGTSCGGTASREGGGGVRVVDISHPTHPAPVSTLPNDRFTRVQDVVVRHVSTPSFTGDLAAVGIQSCAGSGHEGEVTTGLLFYDVTDAPHPRFLSEWSLPQGSIGCHELDLVQRTADGVVLAGCARQVFDQIDPETGGQAPGAVQFVDATDPAHPELLRSWEMPAEPLDGVGCFPVNFAHSIRFDNGGNDAYVSYWDAGTVHLDLTDAASPVIVSDTVFDDEDRDNHSATIAHGGSWLVINPEDFSPGDCGPEFGDWGEAHVYDNSNAAQPELLGTFSTPDSRSDRADGTYTIHNTEVSHGRQLFSSWYSDGIVWWTMDDDGASRQLGQFVPPSSEMFGIPLVWGVYVDRVHDLILASDFGSGLWLVRPTGLKHL
jgi:hypothetical protein